MVEPHFASTNGNVMFYYAILYPILLMLSHNFRDRLPPIILHLDHRKHTGLQLFAKKKFL